MILSIDFIDNELNKKLAANNKIIVYTYFELRVKLNLSKIDANKFLELTKIKLENINYRVYITGETYIFKGHARTVQENEVLVAIKNEKIEKESKRKWTYLKNYLWMM